MINYIVILVLSIWNSILFYGKELGISVILFNIPLLILLIYSYRKNNLINNKEGLLFIIPIILLSTTYLLYDNEFFSFFNVPIIAILFILLHIYTIKPEKDIINLLNKGVLILIEPLTYFSNVFNDIIKIKKDKKFKPKEDNKNLKSLIIIIPIVVLVLILLSTSDMIFGSFFKNIFKIFDNINISESLIDNTLEILFRIAIIGFLFLFISSTLLYLKDRYLKEKETPTNSTIIDSNTIKYLLIILNIIYVIFDIIQIKSLILKNISMDITYAEYARQGFFQLMLVSIINISIILISKRINDKKDIKLINIMNYIMIFLTIIIIISSFIRMHMYEVAYGYTLLRLLVYFTLITEIILLLPTIAYIHNPKISILNYYMVIMITMYTLINFINVDYVIADKNITRYHNKQKLDINYLCNYHADNMPLLVDLYNETNDYKIKTRLNQYFKDYKNFKINGFQEYNISKDRAIKFIKNINNNE